MSADRGRYSKVSRRIWNSPSFKKLSQPKPSGAWLFMRLLTAPEMTSIPGLFQAWNSGLAQSLRWSQKDFDKAFTELLAEGLARADWETGLLWLPKGILHNEPESPNVVLGWKPYWQELPDCELKDDAESSLKAWCANKGKPWLEAFEKASSKSSLESSVKTMANQEQEQEQEQEHKQERDLSEVRAVFEFWRTDTGHADARLTDSKIKHIGARIADGFSVEQLCQVVQNRRLSPHYMGQNDTKTIYDGVDNLFRNTDRVEKLLALSGSATRIKVAATAPLDVAAKEAMRQREAELEARARAQNRAALGQMGGHS